MKLTQLYLITQIFVPVSLLVPPSEALIAAVGRRKTANISTATDKRCSIGLFMAPSGSTTSRSSSISSGNSSRPNSEIDRTNFIRRAIIAPFLVTLPSTAEAFDGGVGGLGKTKPETNVVFSNPDNIEVASSISTPGDYNAELVAPDGTTPAFLSFYAPWPMLRSSGIESRDLASSESAFVQVAPLPEGKSVSNLPKSFFVDTIFGQTGKYGTDHIHMDY